jgi:hypothetical protein
LELVRLEMIETMVFDIRSIEGQPCRVKQTKTKRGEETNKKECRVKPPSRVISSA